MIGGASDAIIGCKTASACSTSIDGLRDGPRVLTMQLAALESLQRLVLPDPWQAKAIQALRDGLDVVLSAPTGAGKTYVFERWAEQGNFSRRALFTVPTRALANDKYAEWKARGWRVGIVTGDVTADPQAPVVVATLEAVQGILGEPSGPAAAGAAAGEVSELRRVVAQSPFQLLVIDEYQWISDEARGNHYEGALLSAPLSLQLLLLSGSVSNPEDVAAWLARLGRRVEVVQTRVRPVPIEEVEADDLVGGLPASIEGFWSRRVAGALRAGYGPILVFAPHRRDAERLARQFARELPMHDPLTLTKDQEHACGPELARLLRARVAYHHSGLTYLQRAGVIEPLAKAGQLKAVVATLGLSAGINFSLRSVMITSGGYRHEHLDRELEPHEILQMIGRAGRRGLDEAGFVLVSSSTPRLRSAAPQRLRRAAPLPWAFLLRMVAGGGDAARTVAHAAGRFFSDEPIPLGCERTAPGGGEALPCAQATDTGRARLVRRRHNPFPACHACARRAECLALDPSPTLLWQWQRLGVLDKGLRLTPRGELVSFFLGPEGLAIAAGLSDRRASPQDIVFECANLFAGDRFSGTNPRRLGPLAAQCERCYRGLSADGYLERGVPPAYGFGAADLVRGLLDGGVRASRLLELHALAGRGDVDRLLIEWRSLLRQVSAAPVKLVRPATTDDDRRLVERWPEFRDACQRQIGDLRSAGLPDLPPLTPDQRRPVNHRLIGLRVEGRVRGPRSRDGQRGGPR